MIHALLSLKEFMTSCFIDFRYRFLKYCYWLSHCFWLLYVLIPFEKISRISRTRFKLYMKCLLRLSRHLTMWNLDWTPVYELSIILTSTYKSHRIWCWWALSLWCQIDLIFLVMFHIWCDYFHPFTIAFRSRIYWTLRGLCHTKEFEVIFVISSVGR